MASVVFLEFYVCFFSFMGLGGLGWTWDEWEGAGIRWAFGHLNVIGRKGASFDFSTTPRHQYPDFRWELRVSGVCGSPSVSNDGGHGSEGRAAYGAACEDLTYESFYKGSVRYRNAIRNGTCKELELYSNDAEAL